MRGIARDAAGRGLAVMLAEAGRSLPVRHHRRQASSFMAGCDISKLKLRFVREALRSGGSAWHRALSFGRLRFILPLDKGNAPRFHD